MVVTLAVAACGDDSVHHLGDSGVPDTALAADASPDALLGQPVASAGPDQRSVVDRRVTLHGAGTGGSALTFAWTQTGGPLTAQLDDPTLAEPTFRVRGAGTYTFSLVVSSDTMTSAPAIATVRVHDFNGGENFTLSLEPDGKLWAWGFDADGELGDGGSANQSVPVLVCAPGATDCAANPFPGVVAISTGASHALALTADGRVWAWGANFDGKIGDGTFDPKSTPVPVCRDATAVDCATDQLDHVIAIAAGYEHSVALKDDGTLWAWGFNGDGELGNGSIGGDFAFPAPVCAAGATPPCDVPTGNILSGITLVAAGGGGHTLALTPEGNVFAFGHNKSGQVGMGDPTVRKQPIPIEVCAPGQVAPCGTFLSHIVDVDAWSGHSLALDDTGQLWGFGGNNNGELGQITTDVCLSAPTCSVSPSQVCASFDSPCTRPLNHVVSFAAGRRYSIALLDDGTMRSWGDDTFGEVGDAETTLLVGPPTPVCAPGSTLPCASLFAGPIHVGNGSFHSIALMLRRHAVRVGQQRLRPARRWHGRSRAPDPRPGGAALMRAVILVAALVACGSDPAHPVDAALDGPSADARPGDAAPDAGHASNESFSTARSVVTAGDATTLVAVFGGGTAAIDNGIGPVNSGVPIATGAVAATTTYTLTVTDTLGGTATASATVTTVDPPSITSFAPDSPVVTIGDATELTAVFDGIGTVAGLGNVSSGVPISTGPVFSTTTYTLSVENATGNPKMIMQTTVTAVP